MNLFVLSPGHTRFCCATLVMLVILAVWATCALAKSPFNSNQRLIAKSPVGDSSTSPSSVDWKNLPISKPGGTASSTWEYHRFRVNKKDPAFEEPLVKLVDYGIAGESFYARKDGLNAPYYCAIPHANTDLWCRKSVAEKLATVNEMLSRYGVEVFVLDGWRSIECQRALWEYFVGVAKRKYPQGTIAQWNSFAAIYCSDPRSFDPLNESTWTVHVTGGAVDLTLKRKGARGEQLFMGGIFDDASPVSSTPYFEQNAINESGQEARRNRRLLYHAMRQTGFTNYGNEWWHYDFGDQMWSMLQRSLSHPAIYGPAHLPVRE